MARLDPYNLRMQISRMFEQGQSLFCTFKVQDWLRERGYDPNEYDIIFHEKPAPNGSTSKLMVEIELCRKDGQPVKPELQSKINEFA
ncbi:MAG: hypothetical protein VKJ02_14845 [Snowella sp.]|nr:hypothetical protein [Snowella sp.]